LSREKKSGGLLFGVLQERGGDADVEGRGEERSGAEESRREVKGARGAAVRREEKGMTGGVALRWIVLLGSSATTALVALARVMPRAYMTGPTSASFAGEIFSADFFLPFEFSFSVFFKCACVF
jgi:hypothetical protein